MFLRDTSVPPDFNFAHIVLAACHESRVDGSDGLLKYTHDVVVEFQPNGQKLAGKYNNNQISKMKFLKSLYIYIVHFGKLLKILDDPLLK